MARRALPWLLALGLAAVAHADEAPTPSPSPPPAARTTPGDAATTVTRDALDRLPRPTDPWSLVREAPGVVVDRVNVGGSETGLQSIVVGGGDNGAGTTWTLDGVDVTDPAALGATALFPDLDALDAVVVRTGALDVRVRTPGTRIDLWLRPPRPRVAGSVHARGADDALQSDNLPDDLAGRPFVRTSTERLTELGAEAGGAPKGGPLWLWGAVSRNELRQQTFTQHAETLRVTTFTARARREGRVGALSALAFRSEKVDEGRDPALLTEPEARWRQSGPGYLFALTGERRLHGVSALARIAWLDAGFRLDPAGGPDANVYEDFRGVLHGSYYTLDTDRPRLQATAEASGQARALGFAHSLLGGLGYRRSTVETTVRWPGNQVLALERDSVFFRAFGLTGFALPMRDQDGRSVHEGVEGYAQDEARRGRLGLTLGLRVDRQQGRALASSVPANATFPELLPAVAFPGGPERFTWRDLLPRAGASFDVETNGRTVVRASYAEYGASLGASDVLFDDPIGRETASVTYYWLDRNGDHAVQPGELDLVRGRLGTSGMDPDDPASTVSPHAIDPDYRPPRTRELAGVVESERFGVHARLRASWRRHREQRDTPLRNLTLADYVIRGAVTGTLFGEPYSVGYYAPASTSQIVPGNGRLLTNREDYRQESGTVELSLSGRAGARVQWSAWGAYLDWREYFEPGGDAIQDPTPLEGEPLQDAGRLVVRPGGLGRGDVFVHARWNAGATVEARLPARFLAASVLTARDGFPVPYFQTAGTGDPTAGSKNVLVAPRVDTYRLPSVLLLDARLSRPFALGRGTLTATLDAFNLLDRGTALQLSRDVELPVFGRPREIMRPRILRLGLAYAF